MLLYEFIQIAEHGNRFEYYEGIKDTIEQCTCCTYVPYCEPMFSPFAKNYGRMTFNNIVQNARMSRPTKRFYLANIGRIS